MFGLRVASSMDVNKKHGGRITNAEGLTDDRAWGKASPWVDYTGPVEGKTVGIAILNHPRSFRYPTTWHVRTYGLFAANPFGWQDFGLGRSGEHTLPAGESIRFGYRVILHEGDTGVGGYRRRVRGLCRAARDRRSAAADDAYRVRIRRMMILVGVAIPSTAHVVRLDGKLVRRSGSRTRAPSEATSGRSAAGAGRNSRRPAQPMARRGRTPGPGRAPSRSPPARSPGSGSAARGSPGCPDRGRAPGR